MPKAREATLGESPVFPIRKTPEFQKALEILEFGNQCVFITGKAGTGKSSLLRHFHENTKKKIVVLAPTGMAAVNVNGVTAHSQCRLPHGMLLPGLLERYRDDGLISQLDAILIDEVSMVRADCMQAIDQRLRENRVSDLPFGGLRIILFGDPFQLEPVLVRGEAFIFNQYFKGKWFWDAPVWRQTAWDYLELTKVFRQSDAEWLEILGRCRCGEATDVDLAYLNDTLLFEGGPLPEGTVHLCATNSRVNEVNGKELANLPGDSRRYTGTIVGEFDQKYEHPSPINLDLKKGAQILFTKNGSGYVNGTVGLVEELDADLIHVRVSNGKRHSILPVARVIWQNLVYKWDGDSGKAIKQEIGYYLQFPLKLAWAITIHKSQGKTLEKALLDLGEGAFCHGQTYVGLSRCRHLSGLKLARPLRHRDFIIDPKVKKFMTNLGDNIRHPR